MKIEKILKLIFMSNDESIIYVKPFIVLKIISY